MRPASVSTRRGLRLSTLVFATLLAGLPAAAQDAPPPGASIVSFGDYLWMRVDGRAVSLEPGSAGYTLPLGARAVIAQGSATMLVDGGTLLRVDAGDDFMLTSEDGQIRLLVNAGSVEVSAPGRAPVAVPAGRFVALTGPDAGVLPGAPAAPAPAAVPAAPAPPPAAPAPPAALPAAPPSAAPPPPVPPAAVVAPAAPPAPAEEGWDPLAALSRAIARLSELRPPRMELVLELHPFYRLTESYDTNIYLVPPDLANGTVQGGGVRGSWITVNQLGTGWKLPFDKRHSLNGFYWGRLTDYGTQPRTNNAADQELRASYDVKGERDSSFSLWNDYLNTEDPAFSEQVARQRRFMDETAFDLKLSRSRALVLGLSGAHRIHKYLDPTIAHQLNRYEADLGARAGVRVAPRTTVYLDYSRLLVHYSAGRTDHSRSDNVGLGVEGRLTDRVSGRAQADVQFRQYEHPAGGESPNTTNLVTTIDLKMQVARRTEATLKVWRALQETTFANNRYYIATALDAGASHTWRKVTLLADGSFEADRYPESTTAGGLTGNRSDDLYSATAGVRYAIRPWLSTGASYQRLVRRSFFHSLYDYTDDRTSVTLDVHF